VRYPATWTWLLTALQLLVTATAITLVARRGALSISGLTGATARLVLALILTPAAVLGLASWLGRPYTPAAFDARLVAIAAVTLLIALTLTLTPRRFVRRPSAAPRAADRTAVALILLAVAGPAMNHYLPGGSFLVWVGLFLALNLLALAIHPECPWIRAVATPVTAAPTALVVLPLALLLFTALTMNEPRLVAALSTVLALTVWLLLAAHLPPLTPRQSPQSPASDSTAPAGR
jgi:hypothetical protein